MLLNFQVMSNIIIYTLNFKNVINSMFNLSFDHVSMELGSFMGLVAYLQLII